MVCVHFQYFCKGVIKKGKILLCSIVPHKKTIDGCEKFSDDKFIAGQKEINLQSPWLMHGLC